MSDPRVINIEDYGIKLRNHYREQRADDARYAFMAVARAYSDDIAEALKILERAKTDALAMALCEDESANDARDILEELPAAIDAVETLLQKITEG